MKTIHLIIILGVVIGSSVIFGVSQYVLQERNISKQCDIPYDENFIERNVISTPQDGKPYFSIKGEFSISHTVPIGEFRVDELAHSLILKPVPTSDGYIIMCDPLPVLEKRFETKLDGLMILVDNEEIEHNIANNVLRIDVNNNTRIEIIGFSNI
ncbi:MAG: hypothetical protein PVI88_02395 [Nitrosopumilaceae archaeon]|jgi:hypothetical protein